MPRHSLGFGRCSMMTETEEMLFPARCDIAPLMMFLACYRSAAMPRATHFAEATHYCAQLCYARFSLAYSSPSFILTFPYFVSGRGFVELCSCVGPVKYRHDFLTRGFFSRHCIARVNQNRPWLFTSHHVNRWNRFRSDSGAHDIKTNDYNPGEWIQESIQVCNRTHSVGGSARSIDCTQLLIIPAQTQLGRPLAPAS